MRFILLILVFATITLTFVYLKKVPFAEKLPAPIATNSVKEPVLSPEKSRKLGANLRLRLNTPSTKTEQVSILLRTNGTLTDEQRTQLETLGAEVRTVAGDIVTATVVLEQVLVISELDFVGYIELSQPLRPESS